MKYRDSNKAIEMIKIGLDQQEQEKYHANIANFNKIIGRNFSEARKRSKQQVCYVCKKQVSSFCNSHSVPKFCIERIAIDGKVFISGLQQSIPYFGDDTGVNSAGTFHIICRDCDSTIFQQYENPLAYDAIPTGQILAQIAMKAYLQMIYKRKFEQELYTIMEENNPDRINAAALHEVKDIDLSEYIDCYNRAKLASNGNHEDWYYLFYYKKLNYTVPLTFQGQITLVCDFDKTIINDIYNPSRDYKTQDIIIAVFPLEKESVIIAFVDARHRRYRKFCRKLNSLGQEEQLSILNYIILKYSENVFLSKSLPGSVFNDTNFINVCQSTSIANVAHPFINPLKTVIDDFDLNKHNCIPNLLSQKYALK